MKMTARAVAALLLTARVVVLPMSPASAASCGISQYTNWLLQPDAVPELPDHRGPGPLRHREVRALPGDLDAHH